MVSTSLTKEQFHKAIHRDVGSPTKKHVAYGSGPRRVIKAAPKTHRCEWASSKVNLATKRIDATVYLNFQKNALTTFQYNQLKMLSNMGIAHYWSRSIIVSGQIFKVKVNAQHRVNQSIQVDLIICNDKDYGRSHNSGVIDASFIYNKGFYGANTKTADAEFKHTAAHEFGHSVLEYFGGKPLSWGHKGSTNPVLQDVKSSTPGYPTSGPIDLMKYYDGNKNSPKISSASIRERSIAAELDVKRLIWMSQLTFTST